MNIKNPIIDPERGCVSGPTLFDLLHKNAGERLEDFEDNTPLDEKGNLCVERFWNFKTGKIEKDMFKVINTFQVGDKSYKTIFVPGSYATFVVDFENRRNFPGLEKGAPKSISSVASFGDKEIVIFGGFDDVKCIDNDGKQIGETCVRIKKIKHKNIDILEFTSWTNPDYSVNDMSTKKSYLGSDGKHYKPKFEKIDSDTGIILFDEIPNILKDIPIVHITE